MTRLRQDLINEYHVSNINVMMQNSDTLGISFINTPYNTLGHDEKEREAYGIALFAKNHYAQINKINRIWVAYVAQKNYIIFQYTEGLSTFVFDKSRLSTPIPYLKDANVREGAIAAYDSRRNQTDVYFDKNLQLYGTLQKGLMLVPHFFIPGNKVVAPKTVILDFASYSDKETFSDNHQLQIFVDDQKLFSGDAQLTSTGREKDGTVNEFLSQQIPYGMFVKLVNGQKVKIVLGPKEIELNEQHLSALRSLKKCVDASRCE
ncbi:MAG: hypothetical protein WCB68_21140 [Pyrinomonadaceae bacterium]